MECCHGSIEHLVCRKMYSKKIENRLTNETVLVKDILNIGIFCTKISRKRGKHFLHKIKSYQFCMIAQNSKQYVIFLRAQNHYKMTSQVLLAGVPGGFSRGSPVFAPPLI